MASFPLAEDIGLVQAILGTSSKVLEDETGISRMTLGRWAENPAQASVSKLESFYSFVFGKGIALNMIHAQLFMEESRKEGLVPLFHGSKQGISGPLSLDHSSAKSDFGVGLYCGEAYQQAAMFVARYPQGIPYFLGFDPTGLSVKRFEVTNEWMLAVAFFRRRLDAYLDHPLVRTINQSVQEADYIIAPIADNRMFQVIDSFIDGEITDTQCEHSLSATDLGFQYVLRSDAALQSVQSLQPHYLCKGERERLLEQNDQRTQQGIDKAKVARRQYRGQGSYIEELLS